MTHATSESDSGSPKFIVFACLIPVLILLSGVFTGLTLGYMDLDKTQLNVLCKHQQYPVKTLSMAGGGLRAQSCDSGDHMWTLGLFGWQPGRLVIPRGGEPVGDPRSYPGLTLESGKPIQGQSCRLLVNTTILLFCLHCLPSVHSPFPLASLQAKNKQPNGFYQLHHPSPAPLPELRTSQSVGLFGPTTPDYSM